MTDEDDREFKAELMRLQQEHRDLDAAIAALQSSPASDLPTWRSRRPPAPPALRAA